VKRERWRKKIDLNGHSSLKNIVIYRRAAKQLFILHNPYT